MSNTSAYTLRVSYHLLALSARAHLTDTETIFTMRVLVRNSVQNKSNMLAPHLLVSISMLLLAENSRCTSNDVKTEASISVSESSTTPAPSLCKICDCTDRLVNCTNRALENHFHNEQWPSNSFEEVTFVGNFLIHLKPFPNVTINRLILRGNRITKIDDKTFKEIRNLTELDLSHNLLTSELLRPSIFEGKFAVEEWEPLAQLRVLNLARNTLHTLTQDVFEHVPHLRVLILSGNPLTTIDHGTTIAISQLLYLEELDLSNCDLTALPDHLFHAPSHLSKLYLNGNRFANPPSALEDCNALEYLSLDDNPFELLDRSNAFPVMPALKELSLCCLPHLTYVGHSVFSKLTALEHLRLQNCPRLKEIDENALVTKTATGAVWPPLKSLVISDNALRRLPSGLVGRWDYLQKLDLVHNEWSCDCENQFLIGTLLPSLGSSLRSNALESMKCAAPPEHAGRNLTSLANRKLRCLDLYNARPERDAAILIGVLIGLLLAIPVALSLFVFWRRGFFFCGNQGPASFSRAFYKRAPPDDDM